MRRRSDESGDEHVRRPAEHLERRRDLFDDAVAHDGDARAERHRLLLIVRDVDHRRGQPPVQQRQLGARADAQDRIEIRERLVEQKRPGLAHDRAAQRHALPLAARELRRLAIEQRLDAERGSRRSHARVDLRRGDAPDPQAERQVLAHALVRVQRVALKHHREVAVLRRHVGHVAAVDEDVPGGRRLEPGNEPKHGALAAAGRPDQDEQLAVGDLEREIARRRLAVRIDLAHLVQRDRRHVSPSPRRR